MTDEHGQAVDLVKKWNDSYGHLIDYGKNDAFTFISTRFQEDDFYTGDVGHSNGPPIPKFNVQCKLKEVWEAKAEMDRMNLFNRSLTMTPPTITPQTLVAEAMNILSADYNARMEEKKFRPVRDITLEETQLIFKRQMEKSLRHAAAYGINMSHFTPPEEWTIVKYDVSVDAWHLRRSNGEIHVFTCEFLHEKLPGVLSAPINSLIGKKVRMSLGSQPQANQAQTLTDNISLRRLTTHREWTIALCNGVLVAFNATGVTATSAGNKISLDGYAYVWDGSNLKIGKLAVQKTEQQIKQEAAVRAEAARQKRRDALNAKVAKMYEALERQEAKDAL